MASLSMNLFDAAIYLCLFVAVVAGCNGGHPQGGHDGAQGDLSVVAVGSGGEALAFEGDALVARRQRLSTFATAGARRRAPWGMSAPSSGRR